MKTYIRFGCDDVNLFVYIYPMELFGIISDSDLGNDTWPNLDLDRILFLNMHHISNNIFVLKVSFGFGDLHCKIGFRI